MIHIHHITRFIKFIPNWAWEPNSWSWSWSDCRSKWKVLPSAVDGQEDYKTFTSEKYDDTNDTPNNNVDTIIWNNTQNIYAVMCKIDIRQ